LTPAISARLHKQSTFRKPAKFDRRETEIFRKRTEPSQHESFASILGRAARSEISVTGESSAPLEMLKFSTCLPAQPV
jgi:hypothetical protein